jgi:LacI family transcriptional regulator
MKRRVTLKDVAKAAGFHVSTVSRALDPNNSHLITAEVAQRIRDVAEKLGYRQNAAAAALRTSRTRMVGVLVPDITNPIFPPIIRGVEDSLRRHGYLSIIGNTDGDPKRESSLVSMLQDRGVDGFIIASVELEDKAVMSLIDDGIAVVTVNRRVDSPAVSSVSNDEGEGIRRVLTHLVSLGHERIAHIAGSQRFSTGANRYRSFLEHREALRLPADPELVVFSNMYNELEGERCVEELLARGRRFTAIVCANDRLAVGAIEALVRRGLKCPDDVSVTGFNDMPMVDRLRPPLTTVRIGQYNVGQQAGELLADMIGTGQREASHVVLPVDLVIRGSTRALTKALPEN